MQSSAHQRFSRRVSAAESLLSTTGANTRSLVRTRICAQAYAGSGRPSIDSIVFFKLQLVMFFEGIRSERWTRVGARMCIDGTKVAANAGKESVKPRFAVEAHLSSLFDTQTEVPGEEEHQQQAAEEPTPDTDEELPAPITLPTSLPPEEDETLTQHNADRLDWIEQEGAQDRRVKSRGYHRIADYQVSTTDPDATIMRERWGS